MVLSRRKLPEGDMTLNFDNASTTSSGVKLKLRILFGSTLSIIERTFEPNGGGADKPGIVANIGRMRVAAKSYTSFRGLVGLANTSSPTGSDEASKRITCGGRAPGGKKLITRLTCRATCAEASAISVLS